MTEQSTKIAYYIGDENTPYVIKVPITPGNVTLKDFKLAINKPNYNKFFFRSEDDDFGVVKEEIKDDSAILPVSENKIMAWLVASEDSSAPPSGKNSVENIPKASNDIDHKLSSDMVRNQSSKKIVDDTSSLCSSRRGHKVNKQLPPLQHHQLDRYPYNDMYASQSTLSMSSYDSRCDESDFMSTLSETTASSRFNLRDRKKTDRKKKRPKRGSDTTSTYSSSITDSSLSLNILTVNLNMEKYNFLGISIVGQTNDNGDGGIYIGSIMKGGAVAADGRIEPGDMLLQVNEVNFENMTNQQAVKVLRDIVHNPGAISLVVAKCWDPVPERNYFAPKNEPVRPIDPAVWASQTINNQARMFPGISPPYSTNLESSSASSLPESERYMNDLPLTTKTEMSRVVKTMRKSDSGLDVKTRMWLKITIPDAFIGSDLIDWLMRRIDGLQERRAARKYASSLLKAGYIRHTVNKSTFSEQCYYVFGTYTGGNANKDMYLAGGETSNNSNSDRDSEIMGPLPTTGSAVAPASWAALQPQNGQFGANINNGDFPPQSLIDGIDGMSIHSGSQMGYHPGYQHQGSNSSGDNRSVRSTSTIRSEKYQHLQLQHTGSNMMGQPMNGGHFSNQSSLQRRANEQGKQILNQNDNNFGAKQENVI